MATSSLASGYLGRHIARQGLWPALAAHQDRRKECVRSTLVLAKPLANSFQLGKLRLACGSFPADPNTFGTVRGRGRGGTADGEIDSCLKPTGVPPAVRGRQPDSEVNMARASLWPAGHDDATCPVA